MNYRLFCFSIFVIIGLMVVKASPRMQYSINEVWKFQKADISTPISMLNDSTWELVSLPHSWNVEDVMDETKGYYRGIGWYQKKISFNGNLNDKKIYLYFEGANQVAELFINGQSIGKHIGGYNAFCFDITNKINLKSSNEITVKLDNSHNDNIPPLSADFTFYGGIYRDVFIIATNKVHFDMSNHASKGVYIQTPNVSADKADVRIFGKIINESLLTRQIKIISKINDSDKKLIKESSSTHKVQPGKVIDFIFNETELKNIKLWSPESPNLYLVTTQITDAKTGEIIDEITNPLGFRFFRFDANKGFFLNGKPYKIYGVNRHQDFKGMGNALPDILHLRDIEMMKEMGVNFLRIAHYPQDPTVLEACDRLGILASVEPPLVNYITESDQFYSNSKLMFTEMIWQSYNHPSVIIWALMNEILLKRPFEDRKLGDSICPREQIYFKNISKLAQDFQDIAKKTDPFRYTMISNHQTFRAYHTSNLTTIPDIIGWNLYPGWYGRDIHQLDTFLLKEHHAKLPTKPLLITEYGADCDTRLRTSNPLRNDCSMEYSNYFHDYYLKAIQKYDFVAGGIIWNFVDFNSEGRSGAIPHINTKGLVTYDRKPKDTFYFYKSQFNKEPVLKIAPLLWEKRTGLQDSANMDICTQQIWVYTNIDKVELNVNGNLIEQSKAETGRVYYNIPFINGQNSIKATAFKNGQYYTDFQQIDFQLQPRKLDNNKLPFKGVNIKCGGFYSYTDALGQLWMPDKPYQQGSWGYIGGRMHYRKYYENPGEPKDILGTIDDALYQTQREGLNAYQFDVAEGEYEVILHFAELLSKKEQVQLLYALGSDKNDDKLGIREFNVRINEKLLLENLNVAKQYGETRAAIIKFPISVTDKKGIKITFEALLGESIINAIQVIKKY